MDFSFLLKPVITGEDATYFDWILLGMGYTASVSVLAFLIAFLIGSTVGTFRTIGGLVGGIATTYFELIRSVPFMAQIFIFYFVFPSLLFPEWIKGVDSDKFTFIVGVISLGVFMSGRISAQVYGGIRALPPSQKQAAFSLGFTLFQTYCYIILPQTMRNILPTLTSEIMNTVKNSAVISTIGLLELSRQAQRIIDFTARPYEAFICIILGYLFINSIMLMIMKMIERTGKL
jgi:glutamate/aspartate transport system permease protein